MMKKTVFNIQDSPFFMGYTNGTYWNGWSCPYFTKETCEEICKYINTIGNGIQKAFYDEAKDAFVVTDPDDISEDNPNGEQERAEGHDIKMENETLRLYSFGAFNWIWDDAHDIFDNPEEFVLYYLKNCCDIPMSVVEDAYDDITERCFAVTGKPQIIDVPEYVDEYLRR